MFRDHYAGPLAKIVDEAITWDEIAGVEKLGARLLHFDDSAYPPLLADVSTAPPVLTTPPVVVTPL